MILLGRKIKNLRNEYRLTQTELAIQVGVTKSTIAAYENDSRLPSYEVLIKLAEVFKVSIDSILNNHSEFAVNVHGLNIEQIQIVEHIIAYFRKSNAVEKIIMNASPELKEQLKEYYN